MARAKGVLQRDILRNRGPIAMTAPDRLDVLAWIAEAAKAIDRAYGLQAQLPKEAPAISAAIRELIEAADDYYDMCGGAYPNTRLEHALAALRGVGDGR